MKQFRRYLQPNDFLMVLFSIFACMTGLFCIGQKYPRGFISDLLFSVN